MRLRGRANRTQRSQYQLCSPITRMYYVYNISISMYIILISVLCSDSEHVRWELIYFQHVGNIMTLKLNTLLQLSSIFLYLSSHREMLDCDHCSIALVGVSLAHLILYSKKTRQRSTTVCGRPCMLAGIPCINKTSKWKNTAIISYTMIAGIL